MIIENEKDLKMKREEAWGNEQERKKKDRIVCQREISSVFQSVPLFQRLRISWSKARRAAAVVNESRGSSRYSYAN